MPRFPRKPLLLLLGLSILLLAGCSTPDTAPTSAAAIAQSIGHIRPSRRDTCETQQQVAAQSSKLDTITSGKETVYKADCSLGGAADRPSASRPAALVKKDNPRLS
jgi:hypothetical protein